MATQAQSQGRYAVINTLLNTTDVTLIDSLSGRQGDNGRVVYFAIKDGNLPHNLDGQNVVLTAKDSAGKVKQISGVNDMISSTGGLFSMLIPGEMYQSAGDIEEAYISVQDSAGTVISSIPVTFTVLANNILFTANASKDYIDSVQQAIDEANSRISGVQSNVEAQQIAYDTLKTSIENLTNLVKSNNVAVQNVANDFTEINTFDKDITVKGTITGTLAGKATLAGTADKATTLDSTAILDNVSKLHTSTLNAFGTTLTFQRIGNTVTINANADSNSYTFNPFTLLYASGTIPAGYRPAKDSLVTLEVDEWNNSTDERAGNLMFGASGFIGSRSGYSHSKGSWLVISGSYLTNDAMPN